MKRKIIAGILIIMGLAIMSAPALLEMERQPEK